LAQSGHITAELIHVRVAARQARRRTVINKSRRSRMRSAIRKVEAIAAGDRSRATAAMVEAEPALIRAAQKGIVRRNLAQRKVSRLSHQIAKLEKK
jgi:small subunit ribosomal protein S20